MDDRAQLKTRYVPPWQARGMDARIAYAPGEAQSFGARGGGTGGDARLLAGEGFPVEDIPTDVTTISKSALYFARGARTARMRQPAG